MEAPRQWINTWLKEHPKRFDLVDCFYACYHSSRQKGDIPFNNTVRLISRPELNGFKDIDSVDRFHGMLPES